MPVTVAVVALVFLAGLASHTMAICSPASGVGAPMLWVVLAAAVLAGLAASMALARRAARAEAEARDARRLCALLFQTVNGFPGDVQIKGRDLRYRWINEEYTRVRGLTLAAIAGRTPEEIGLDPAEAAAATAHDLRVLESGQREGPDEQFIMAPDGEIRRLSKVVKYPLFEDGRIAYLVTVGVDLTHVREDQRRGDDARRLLETVMEAAPITIQVIDRDFRIRWANQAFREHFEWQDVSPVGRALSDVAAMPDLLPATIAANQTLFSGEAAMIRLEQHYDATAARPERHLQVTKVPIRDATGEIVRVLTMGVDITEQKKAEASADIANRLMTGILSNVPLSIQVKDADLRFRWANREFARAVHREPGALTGKTLDDLDLPADHVARTHEQDRHVLAAGETLRFSERWVTNGIYRTMMVVKAPLIGADGQATHVITIGADVTELHNLRVEADTARRQLQAVLDAVPVAISLKGTDRRYRWINKAFAEAQNVPMEAILGRRVEEAVDLPDLTAAVTAADEMLLSTGIEPPPMTQRHIGANGQELIWSCRRLPLRDETGAIEGILVVGVNVTELTRATEALQRLNADLEVRDAERSRQLDGVNEFVAKVLESAPLPIVTFRSDGTITSWNPAAEALTGVSSADALRGKLPPRSPAGQAAFEEAWRRVVSGQSLSGLPSVWRRADGTECELLVSGAPLRRADGTVDGIVALWLDVTERNKAERELAAVRANLLDAVESMNSGVILFDQDDRVILFNSTFVEHHREVSDLIAPGRTFEERYRASLERGVMAIPPGRSLEDQVAARLEAHRRADGTKQTTSRTDGRAFEVWESRTRNGGIISIGVEVTEQRKLEQQLRQAQRMEAVGQLTGGIAHDFNNLLAVVIGNLDLLLLAVPAEGEARALADQAIEAAERGAALTSRLLAFARRQTLRPAPTNIGQLVDGMVPLLHRAVGETIQVECVCDAGTWPASIDPSQLESAILNLTLNARDAMPDGGKLRIAASNAVLDEASDLADQDVAADDYVHVSVSDTGTGIAPDIIGQVFEPFFSTKETGKGSGLGLSMVFGFVRQSGGHVRLHSELGVGTTVSLYLPRGEQSETPRTPDTPVMTGHGETVLLVEDNPHLRAAAANMVAALGYRVLTAEDAASALSVLETDPDVAVLFSDVILPGGRNGFDLAREARTLRPDLAAVFTSGFADPAMVSTSNPELGVPILTKPYRRSQLAEALWSSLRRRAPVAPDPRVMAAVEG